MSAQKLYCKLCQSALTRPLQLSEDVREFQRFQAQDDSLEIPIGDAWIVEIHPASSGRAPEKQIWFSPQSLADDVITDRDTYGCCGYEGRENARCKCGRVVGSRIDECAHQPRFEPNPQMTYWASANLAEIGGDGG